MQLSFTDVAIFVGFYLIVVGVSLYKSRREKDSAEYFLGGRRLPWWLIGISIVAANISTEQLVGMAGQASGSVGLAVSAWQLTGAIGIVIVAFTFLPRFLRSGIYTMPEYLEYRYNPAARGIMSVLTVLIYVTVTTVAVLYSGGTVLKTVFGFKLAAAVWLVGGVALVYTVWGGLLASVWADLFQGTALLIGGLLTFGLGLAAVGGPAAFFEHNADKLHMILPSSHEELPWTVLVGGMWIPIFYYCGLNQFIVQRSLAARTLKQGQQGVIFAAALWLLIPFAVVMPGIMAQQLYADKIGAAHDEAYPTLIRELIPAGLRGFIFAAIAGAVISSIASMLNSASTIFTMDIYKRHLNALAGERKLVTVGRASTCVFLIIACCIAITPVPAAGVFKFIQENQGFISPGIVAAFAFGMIVKRAPASAGVAALVLNPVIYGILLAFFGGIPYLHRMVISLLVVLGVMAVITAVRPLKEPRVLPVRKDLDMTTSPSVVWQGAAVIAAVIAFFIIFR
jgi:solute:Na+ symporter, SSS family